MRIRNLVLAVVLSFLAQGSALADRQLDKAEILQIFQTLTEHPRRTWIPSGTVEAKHFAYKASNGYTTESTVIVKYDGDKFYWEINIDSHTKESEPRESPAGKSSGDDFNLKWNKKRVFVWDGNQYTMYCKSANNAIVFENPSDIPVVVNGPLTAGIVPWGHGVYTLESLLAAESSAVEVGVNDQKHVRLTLKKTDMPEMVFALDPTKDYALLYYSLSDGGMSSITKSYGDYELVSGKWIPTTIIIERYDESKQSPELFSYDYWDLTSISITLSHPASFRVPYESDALVEVYSPITDEPLSYRYSNDVDTDSLLQERLAIVADDMQTQNCATVAMKYVAEQLGKNATDSNVAGLVSEPNDGTSLYQMRQVAQELGFRCLAVKTDIQALKNLKGCQTILHLPGPNHYVVLESIDADYVWVIDLDSNKFFYRTRLDDFSLDWNAGTALLISNEPLNLEPTSSEISDTELHKIIGSAGGGFGTWSCEEEIQKYDWKSCSWAPPAIVCSDKYRIWWRRKGCIPNSNGGSCAGTKRLGNSWSYCAEDPNNPGNCMIDGDWYHQSIRACE